MTAKKGSPELRCPGCGKRPVPVKNGRVDSHVTPGNMKCYWIGQDIRHVGSWNKIVSEGKRA